MVDRHRELLDDPIMRRVIDALERRGFSVRGETAEQTILRVRRILDENPRLATARGGPDNVADTKD